MRVIKLDVEKIKHCIDGYKDEHDKSPYLIMSNKTKELLPPSISSSCDSVSFGDVCISSSAINAIANPIDIVINGTRYIAEDKIRKEAGTWCGCRILIDDKLELGEVHIG